MKIRYLYHGSTRPLVGEYLLPNKPYDLENKLDNLHEAVYATSNINIAIVMAIISSKGVNYASLKFDKKPYGEIYEGWPKQKFVYLYVLPSKTFIQSGEKGKQWISNVKVKPLKCLKIKIDKYLSLVRKVDLPRNKEHFIKLKEFAKKVIKLCRKAGFEPVIYGSYAHFFYTRDESMNVNDIDLWIPESKYSLLIKLLNEKGIKYKYYEKWHTMSIENGKLKVEADSLDYWYKDIKRKLFPRKFNKIDFFGEPVKIITLKNMEAFYEVALKNSTKTKPKVKKRIKLLEKFLGRRLKWKK